MVAVEPLPRSAFPQHMRNKSWINRLSYVSVVAMLSALVFTTPRNYARSKETGHLKPEVTVPAFILLALAAMLYFSLQASDPGYLNISSDGGALVPLVKQQEHMLHSPSRDRVAVATWPTDSGAGVALEEVQMVLGSGDHLENDSDTLSRTEKAADDDDDMYASSDEEDLRLDMEVDEALDGQLLGVPTSQLPLRSKYCRHSRRVVATYDHYCAILGTTIGERNHARFWWFLLVQSMTIWLALSIVHSGFHDTKAVVSTWIFYNGHALAASILLWLLFLLVGGLLAFHTFLAIANLTSYEFMRANKISYLQGSEDFDLPFSMGLRENLRFFCCAEPGFQCGSNEWQPKEWLPFPPIVRDSDDWYNNLWENKYWACC